MNATGWLQAAIDELKRHDNKMLEQDLYSITHAADSETALSLICEHPSLTLVAGHVHFRPFAAAHNRNELLEVFRQHFPNALRRVDFFGLYKFVDADIDELIFNKYILVLDNTVMASMVYSMKTPSAPKAFVQKWLSTMGDDDDHSRRSA